MRKDRTDDESDDRSTPVVLDRSRALHAFDLGVLTAIAIAVVYGALTYPLGLSWGLVAIGFLGGLLIGSAVSRGAWRGQTHMTDRRLQLLAAAIGGVAWLGGLAVAYLMTQALFPDAATGLLERLSFAGFNEYATRLYETNALGHAGALAAMAFMAWRGAR